MDDQGEPRKGALISIVLAILVLTFSGMAGLFPVARDAPTRPVLIDIN